MAWKIVPAASLREDARGECLIVDEHTQHVGPAPSHTIVAQAYSSEYAERIVAGERARVLLPWAQRALFILFLSNLGAFLLFAVLLVLQLLQLQATVIGASF